MKKSKKAKRVFVIAFAVVIAFLPPLLCFYLLNRGVQGALMYGGVAFLPVNIVSVLGAAGVLFLFKDYDSSHRDEEDEPCEEEFEESDGADSEPDEGLFIAKEEYPELFSERKGEEPVSTTPSYYEALTNALKAQRGIDTDRDDDEGASSGADDELCDFLSVKSEKEAEQDNDIFSDLPDTLPEGYTAYEEPEDDEIEEEVLFEEPRQKKAAGSAIKKAVTAVLLFALPIGLAVFLSFFRTEYYKDGACISNVFGEVRYLWRDCIGYEISPAFFGDRLSMVLCMEDGTKVELIPSDGQFIGDEFDHSYEYALYVAECLDSLGVEKRVKEKNTLEGDLALREDIAEYVRKLIE